MHYLSADHLVVYAFLIITLIIGLRAGRGIKDIREYAIANKTFSTAAIVLTFLATDLAGESILDLAGEVSKTGIILAVVFIIGVGGGFLIQALFIAPNIVYFDQSITMGDVMGTLYGVNSKIIAGVLGFFTAICVAGMELTVLGLLCESLLGIDYRWGIGLGGIVLAMYAAHGGIKSVTATDLFQFSILLVGIPMLTLLALKQAGGMKVVLTQIPATQLKIFDHPNFSYYLVLFLGKILFQFPMVDPALIQRFLMAKTRTQLRNQFLTLAVFSPALYLTIMLIGMAGLVLYPTLKGQQVVPHLINNLLPVGLRGIAIAGLFAVTMSTIDSFLHAAGLTLVYDVLKPLCVKRGISIQELNWTKWVTVFISLFAIAIGFARAEDLYGILLVSYEVTCPVLALPLWCGIMGLKPDRRAFYTATGITLVVLSLSKLLLPATHTYLAPLISVIANGIVFLGLHGIRNQGFVIVSRKQAQEYLWKPRPKGILTQFKQLLPTPKAILAYSNTKVIEYGAPYMTLGIFCLVNYIIPYFMWEHASAEVYDRMLYLRFIGALACSLLIVKDAWPSVLSRYLPAFWHLTLLYCLPFTSTVMFLLTQGSVEWLINVAVTIMFLIVLVDWVSFFILTILGIALGFLCYTQLAGAVTLKLDFTTGYLLIYQAIFATLIGLLFARRRQQKFDRLAASKQNLNDAHQATINRLVEALHYQDRISKNLGKEGIGILEQVYDLSKELQEKAMSTADHSLQTTSEKLVSIAAYFKEVVERAKDYLKLHVVKISLDTLLQEVYTNIKIQDLLPSASLSLQLNTQHKELQCDAEKMKKLLINAIGYLHGRNPNNHQIHLEVASTQLGYQIASIKDYIKKVDALRFVITTEDHLPSLSELYIADTGAALVPPDSPIDLPKVENERIIAAHYGVFENYETAEGYTHIYVIPLRIRDIRPSTMDLEEIGRNVQEALVAYPGAIELENSLKDKVKKTAPEVSIEKVTEAIRLIKKYHTTQQRKSGEPFYFHPIWVAEIVLAFSQQEEVIIAALLHDIVEDTPMGLEQIAAMFNATVAYLVEGVTNFDKGAKRLNLSSHEVIKKLTDEEDARVLYIKLADRIHNMRTIKAHPSYKKQKQIAEETLQFFVPMAKHLGLHQAVEELNSLIFEVLNRVMV